ncbi:MAG: hypothetical protein R3D62_16990 [Xanthobacteraceae bacterium]
MLSVALATAGAVAATVAMAGQLRPDEARRFVAGKLFSYTCFDGTSGMGRIHADGSVIGTIQTRGHAARFVAMPRGTIRVTPSSICASLRGSLIQPCFNVVQTSSVSFRGSVSGLGFAYCDFVRHNPRQNIRRSRRTTTSAEAVKPAIPAAQPVSMTAPPARPVQSAVAVNIP